MWRVGASVSLQTRRLKARPVPFKTGKDLAVYGRPGSIPGKNDHVQRG